MKQFITNHQADVMGVLNGLDRIRFRGTQRWLATERGMMSFLWKVQVKLKEFKKYALDITRRLRQHIEGLAEQNGRPSVYLYSSRASKEHLAKQVAQRDGIEGGLIGVWGCVEPAYSFAVGKNAAWKRLELRRPFGKCLHYYLYFIDPVFGFGHLRLQTWFPFTIHVNFNGREWLCRELDRQHIGYVRRENCLVAVEDFAKAQTLLDLQVSADWQGVLNRLAKWAFPWHQELLLGEPLHYYWSADETEWASDVLFRSPERLARLYPALLRQGIETFSCGDVLRFLGQKTTAKGNVHGRFAGEIQTDLRRRDEGVRLKHRLNKNSIKMYDKQGSVLRVETTIVDPRDLKVYRQAEGDPESQLAWRRLRKGVCDLPRRCELSQASNDRYLEALSAVEDTTPLGELGQIACGAVRWQGRSVRGLRPFNDNDRALLEAVMRGEFAIRGFRNGELRVVLYGETPDPALRRRQSAKITRQVRMLRAHGLIKKLPKTHRYVLTGQGRTTLTALLVALKSNTKHLNRLAA
jgi:hypothetical protein